MTLALASILGVMFLLDPTEVIDAEAAAVVSEDADRVALPSGPVRTAPPEAAARKRARIRSRRSDFDRNNGVMLFEGNAFVEYGTDYTLCADRVFAFLVGSNEMSRVVAVGHVTITNDLRVGTCGLAVYRRKRGEIEMFGDAASPLAHLRETGKDASDLQGSRITFWLDTEQVEVDNTQIGVEKEKGDVRKLL